MPAWRQDSGQGCPAVLAHGETSKRLELILIGTAMAIRLKRFEKLLSANRNDCLCPGERLPSGFPDRCVDQHEREQDGAKMLLSHDPLPGRRIVLQNDQSSVVNGHPSRLVLAP